MAVSQSLWSLEASVSVSDETSRSWNQGSATTSGVGEEAMAGSSGVANVLTQSGNAAASSVSDVDSVSRSLDRSLNH